MEDMVEPDLTIMIVSIIGLVVLWGSFFYHKFVQDPAASKSGGEAPEAVEETPAVALADPQEQEESAAPAPTGGARSKKGGKKKGKKRR